MAIMNLTKEQVRERNRELAKERMLETKKKDMKNMKDWIVSTGLWTRKKKGLLRQWDFHSMTKQMF